jgi:hypothetical protein
MTKVRPTYLPTFVWLFLTRAAREMFRGYVSYMDAQLEHDLSHVCSEQYGSMPYLFAKYHNESDPSARERMRYEMFQLASGH